MAKKKSTKKAAAQEVRHNSESIRALASRIEEINASLIACAKELDVYNLESIPSSNHETTMLAFTYLDRFVSRTRSAIRKELEDRGHYNA